MTHIREISFSVVLFTLQFFSISIDAQISITGNVMDAHTERPVGFAFIRLENGDIATNADKNGMFSMDIPEPGNILISRLGYEPISISVSNDIHLEIKLNEINNILEGEYAPILISGRAINLKLPAALMQIHPEHLKRDNDVSITPSLNRVTGVFMHSGALNTNRITIRGIGNRSPFSTTKIRAYLDDIPLTSGDGETTIEDMDLSLIRKVDVWKGPTASVFGAGLGGMIHLRSSDDGQDIPISIKTGLTLGSYGLARSVTQADYSNAKQTLKIGINFNTTHSDGYRANNTYDRHGGSLLVKYKWSPQNETTLFGNHITLKAFIPSSLNREDYDENPEKAAFIWNKVQGFEDNSKNLFGISHQFGISNIGSWYLSNKSSVFATSRDSYESRPFNILGEESNSFGLRSTFELRTKSSNQKSFPLLSLGVEAFQENYDWKTFQTDDGVEGELISDNKEFRNYTNLYLQSYCAINDKMTFFTGLNFNSTKYTYNDLFRANGIDKSGKYSFESILSPHIGINYQFKYKLSFFATISHGFSPPSLSETLTPDGNINPDIAPEKGWNFEIGSRGKVLSKLTYELTAYSMRIKDLLVARRVGEDQYVGLNAGKTLHNGVELFLEYQMINSTKFQVVPFLTYTYSDYKFDDFVDDTSDFSGNNLTGTPPHQLNTGVDFASNLGLYGNFNFRYVDAFPMRDDNTIYSDSYEIVNLKLGYGKRFFKKLYVDISMGIRNIFDKKYASMILINAGSFGGNLPRYYYPGLPRNYFTSLSIRYIFERDY